MKLPELPLAFGNYALGEFVEVQAPAAPGWWPQTAAWAWFGALLGLVLLRLVWLRWRRWRQARYRREALRALRQLPQSGQLAAAQLSELLKRTALTAYARQAVAPLHGQAWIDFLNDSCPAPPPFDDSLGRTLSRGQYCKEALNAREGAKLHWACDRWIREHREHGDA